MDKLKMAANLKRLRGKKTQEEVAKACGIGLSAYSMYEIGQRVPRDEAKIKIAEYFGKSVNYIFFK